MSEYSIGLDFGTNSVRAIVVDVSDGRELGACVWDYAHGQAGILLSDDPNLARQHPEDYVLGAQESIRGALEGASKAQSVFSPDKVIGVGVDTTGSTPIPVDRDGLPLAFQDKFTDNLAAMAWLWKDHTSVAEAEEITKLAAEIRPEYLTKCGGTYNSECFFSKILHCLRTVPEVFDAAWMWVEIADWIPAMLTNTQSPEQLTVGICAAGHRAMFNPQWGGYPDAEFLAKLDPKLGTLRERLKNEAFTINKSVGGLCEQWAKKTSLPVGIPVAVGAYDAHLGAVGAGISPGRLVKIIGTSTCDMMVAPQDDKLEDIPGLCGIVPGGILPGAYGLEAGQSAVGDIFNWFVNVIQPGGAAGTHEALTEQAGQLKPGESGLLALDWNNGNRTVLVDQRLTGMLLGQTLYTTPAEIYRALIEATAFGALTIINRFEQYGVAVQEVINCGGIAEKNPVVMQIYADVTNRAMKVSRSAQTCALGAAIAGSVVGGTKAGGYATVKEAQDAMTGVKPDVYQPDPEAHEIYKELFTLYSIMHDAMGICGTTSGGETYDVMKKLIEIRTKVRT